MEKDILLMLETPRGAKFQKDRGWNLEHCGHNYVDDLTEAIVNEVKGPKISQEDEDLVRQIVMYYLKCNCISEAVDFCYELGCWSVLNQVLQEYQGDRNGLVQKISKYMVSCAAYLSDLEEEPLYETAFNLSIKHKMWIQALMVAMKCDDIELVYKVVQDCDDVGVLKQIAFILAREGIMITRNIDPTLVKIMSNQWLLNGYYFCAKEFGVEEAIDARKLPHLKVIKDRLSSPRSPKVKTRQQRLKTFFFANGLINCASGIENVIQKFDPGVLRVRYGLDSLLSITSSFGLVHLWNVEGADEFYKAMKDESESENEVRTGALMCAAISRCGINLQDRFLEESEINQIEEGSWEVQICRIIGLGVAYAGQNNPHSLNILVKFLLNDRMPLILVGISALSISLTTMNHENSQWANLMLKKLIQIDSLVLTPENLVTCWFLSLSIGLCFLGKGVEENSLAKRFKEIQSKKLQGMLETVFTMCSFAGTGNVLKIQEMLHTVTMGKEGKESKDRYTTSTPPSPYASKEDIQINLTETKPRKKERPSTSIESGESSSKIKRKKRAFPQQENENATDDVQPISSGSSEILDDTRGSCGSKSSFHSSTSSKSHKKFDEPCADDDSHDALRKIRICPLHKIVHERPKRSQRRQRYFTEFSSIAEVLGKVRPKGTRLKKRQINKGLYPPFRRSKSLEVFPDTTASSQYSARHHELITDSDRELSELELIYSPNMNDAHDTLRLLDKLDALRGSLELAMAKKEGGRNSKAAVHSLSKWAPRDATKSMATIGIALIALGEPIGKDMALRVLQQIIVSSESSARRMCPLAFALLNTSNPDITVLEILERFSKFQPTSFASNSIIAAGLLGAGTLNGRVNRLLKGLVSHYESGPATCVNALLMSTGLLYMGKGLLGINLLRYDQEKVATIPLAATLIYAFSCLDARSILLGQLHHMSYLLVPAIQPRYTFTVDENTLEPIQSTVRVGKLVDTVGQVGKIKVVSGAQVHTSPISINPNEKAEIISEGLKSLTDYVEGVVLIRKD